MKSKMFMMPLFFFATLLIGIAIGYAGPRIINPFASDALVVKLGENCIIDAEFAGDLPNPSYPAPYYGRIMIKVGGQWHPLYVKDVTGIRLTN